MPLAERACSVYRERFRSVSREPIPHSRLALELVAGGHANREIVLD